MAGTGRRAAGAGAVLAAFPLALILFVWAAGPVSARLFAVGEFTSIGGVNTTQAAVWSDGEWSRFGVEGSTGFDGSLWPHTLATFSNRIYVGGLFTKADNQTATNLASAAVGQAWAPVGTGCDDAVAALAAFRGRLYIGGLFNACGGVLVNRVASYDGVSAAPSPLGSGAAGGAGVYTFIEYQEKLFIGGNFAAMNGTSVGSVALWDGDKFLDAPVRVSGSGTVIVRVFAATQGKLYIGGWFSQVTTSTSTISVSNLVEYNGNTGEVRRLGQRTFDNIVVALASYTSGVDNLLCAGGGFPDVLACWNFTDSSWVNIGTFIATGGPYPAIVITIAAFEDRLFVGGDFASVDGIETPYLAVWDGSNWLEDDSVGADGAVVAMLGVCEDAGPWRPFYKESCSCPTGYIGTDCSEQVCPADTFGPDCRDCSQCVNGECVRGVAGQCKCFNGYNQSTPLDGCHVCAAGYYASNGKCTMLESGRIVVGGSFNSLGPELPVTGGVAVGDVASGTWSALGTPVLGGTVHDFLVSNNTLYATGDAFSAVNSAVAKWDPSGRRWSVDGMALPDPRVGSALTIVNASEIVLVNSERMYHLSADTGSWWNIGVANGTILATCASNGKVYVGGLFSQLRTPVPVANGTVTAWSVAMWDGSYVSSYPEWQALGAGLHTSAVAADTDPSERPAVDDSEIAAWPYGPDFGVAALAVYRGTLYAGGAFTRSGNVAVRNIAKWSGSAWQSVGSGADAGVTTLVVWNNRLYAGGYFTTMDGVTANGVASWDGVSWSSLGNGVRSLVPGSTAVVMALAVYSQTALYAGGSFSSSASPAPKAWLARWQNGAWSSNLLPSDDVVGSVNAIASQLVDETYGLCSACVHGSCVETSPQCICDEGWAGTNCDMCPSGNCSDSSAFAAGYVGVIVLGLILIVIVVVVLMYYGNARGKPSGVTGLASSSTQGMASQGSTSAFPSVPPKNATPLPSAGSAPMSYSPGGGEYGGYSGGGYGHYGAVPPPPPPAMEGGVESIPMKTISLQDDEAGPASPNQFMYANDGVSPAHSREFNYEGRREDYAPPPPRAFAY